MSSALVVTLYFALVPLIVVALSTALIIRGYSSHGRREG